MGDLQPFALPPEPGLFSPEFIIPEEIIRAFGALALAVNHGLEPEQERVTAFALRDLPVERVVRACERLMGTAKFWPRPSEIREAAGLVARADAERSRRLSLPASDEPTYQCWQCLDEPGGWIVLGCPATTCGRQKAHEAHPFAVRCPHWLKAHEVALQERGRVAMQESKPVPPAFEALSDLLDGRYRFARAQTLASRRPK